MLKLFVLNLSDVGWDQFNGFAVLAENETQARRLAQDAANAGEYGKGGEPWINQATCEELTLWRGPARVVLSSFNAG